MEKNKTDKNVLDMFEYLAWCSRANLFEGDFKNKFIVYGTVNFSWDKTEALHNASIAWKSIKSRGLIETYQEYIQDKDFCKTLIHSIKI